MLNLLQFAVDSLGIYPDSVGDVQRDRFGDGWNAAVMSLSKRPILPPAQRLA